MDRRNFFQNILGGVASLWVVPKAFGKLGLKSRLIDVTPDKSIAYAEPISLFDKINFKDGQIPEFPLDFIVDDNATPVKCVVAGGNCEQPLCWMGLDFVYVPILFQGVCIDWPIEETHKDAAFAQQELENMLNKKLNLMARDLLLSAALHRDYRKEQTFDWLDKKTNCLTASNQSRLMQRMRYILKCKSKDLAVLIHKGFLVGVNRKDKDKLVMPVLNNGEGKVYKDISLEKQAEGKIGYYSFARFGLGVLQNDYVVCGKLS